MISDAPSRRDFLSIIGASSLIGFSGCSDASQDPSSTATPKSTGSGTVSPSPTSSPTLGDDVAPSILSHQATPEDFGRRLRVALRGEDNRNITYAAIRYGDRVLEGQPSRPLVELKGVLGDIPDAQPTPPGEVVYILRDTGGNETVKTAFADETAPTLSVQPSTPKSAGELVLALEGEDNVGLHELRAALNCELVLSKDMTGRKHLSTQQTVSSVDYDSVTPGEMNLVGAELEDAMGNSTRKRMEQYVRKFDVFENPELDVAVSYVPWFNRTDRWEACTDGHPSIGYYSMEDTEALLQQTDYMQGFGLTTLQLHFDRPEKYTRAFTRTLDKQPLDSMPLEIYYTRPFVSTESNTVIEQLNESFDYVVDYYLSRTNYNTLHGQQVISFWDIDWIPWAGTPEAREARDAIMSEWGSYEGFVDFIRSKHTVED